MLSVQMLRDRLGASVKKVSKLPSPPCSYLYIYHFKILVGYHGNGYQCEIDKCDDLKRIRNGHKTNSNVTYGSIVKFSCNNGFRLSGAKSVLCQSKGQWNDSKPTCTGMYTNTSSPSY